MRVAIIPHHPTQYEGPQFKRLAENKDIEIKVYYESHLGVVGEHDLELDKEVAWDIPMLDGYNHTFLNSNKPLSFLRELFKDNPDCLIIHGYRHWSSLTAMCYSFLKRKPILYVGDSIINPLEPSYKKLLKKLVFPPFFESMQAFLVVGSLNKQFYKYYGVPDRKMFLVPYAVDNDYFKVEPDEICRLKNDLRKNLDIPENIPIILGVLKFIDRERPLDLLEAYKKLLKKEEASLVLVGDGPQRDLIENNIVRNNLNLVRLPGYVKYSDLRGYYSLADVFVHPGTRECWGLSVNEAMAAGLPVVASNLVGSTADLVRHGGNGFIFPATNVDDLAGYLEKVISDLQLAHKMGAESKSIISSWSYNECIEGIVKAIESIVKDRNIRLTDDE